MKHGIDAGHTDKNGRGALEFANNSGGPKLKLYWWLKENYRGKLTETKATKATKNFGFYRSNAPDG